MSWISGASNASPLNLLEGHTMNSLFVLRWERKTVICGCGTIQCVDLIKPSKIACSEIVFFKNCHMFTVSS